MMEFLHRHLAGLFSSPKFNFVSVAALWLNPIAIAPQLVSVLTVRHIQGVSPIMWFIFLVTQGAVALEGVRAKRKGMFLSMAVSMIESVSIIVVLMVRT